MRSRENCITQPIRTKAQFGQMIRNIDPDHPLAVITHSMRKTKECIAEFTDICEVYIHWQKGQTLLLPIAYLTNLSEGRFSTTDAVVYAAVENCQKHKIPFVLYGTQNDIPFVPDDVPLYEIHPYDPPLFQN